MSGVVFASFWRAALYVVALSACIAAAEVKAAAYDSAGEQHVLVLYAYDRLLPAAIEFDRGLRQSLSAREGKRITLHEEFLEQPRFEGIDYDKLVVQFLQGKYRTQSPDAIVAGGVEALRFLLKNRATLFPGVPVVFEGVYSFSMPSLPPLPPDVIGVPIDPAFSDTMDFMLRTHAGVRRVVVVTGAGPGLDKEYESSLRAEFKRFEDRVAVEFIAGLPHSQVLARLRALGRDTVVFTPGYFRDGEGRNFLPADAVRDLTAASAVPVYGHSDTLIGAGIVGGYMRTFNSLGIEVGEVIRNLLEGVDAATLRHTPPPPLLYLDWRQVKRWGIDGKAIPRDAVIEYRSPTIWEAYRAQVLLGLVVVLLQGALIVGLLTERFRRRRAERAVEQQRFELAHASRLAVAGELTAAIAHEINQPLSAILSNADTAEMILQSDANRSGELREILSDIRRDDLRASEVIRRLRTLLARHEVERHLFDVNEVAADAILVVRSEAARRSVVLGMNPASGPASTMGDRIQMQQVLINLILNAMDAVADVPTERRTVNISIARQLNLIEVVVSDRGHGIAAEHLPRLFDSFFSTKRQGMGLGLSIVRSLIEAQGGRVWAGNHPEGGAVFHIELRSADEPVTAGERVSADIPAMDST